MREHVLLYGSFLHPGLHAVLTTNSEAHSAEGPASLQERAMRRARSYPEKLRPTAPGAGQQPGLPLPPPEDPQRGWWTGHEGGRCARLPWGLHLGGRERERERCAGPDWPHSARDGL